jgi:hypothetical protein
VTLGCPQSKYGANWLPEIARNGRRAQSVRSKAHAAGVLPYVQAAHEAGAVTLKDVAAALTARGVRTPKGGAIWHVNQVRRIKRLTS